MSKKPVRQEVSEAAPTAAKRRGETDPRLDNDTPIYVQLITHFRQQIESGKWPVNRTVPTLEDLAAEFGVARGTVRQAVGFLQREGLIASRRGRRRTFVVRKPEYNIWLPLPNAWADLVESADSIEGEALDLAAPVRLPVPPETGRGALAPSYFVMRRLLKRDGIPYLVGTSYVDRRIMAEVGADRRGGPSIYRILEQSRRSRPRSGEQTLTLGTADAEVAYLLEIPLNSAIVCVLRWVLDERDTLIYQSEGQFRSDFVQAYRRLR